MKSTRQPKIAHLSAVKTLLAAAISVLLGGLPGGLSAATQTFTNQQSMQQKPKIQLAILLDTSNSMDGLIDQARNQLWQVVNEFSKAKRNGVRPTLEVAVYEYGNDGLSPTTGYTRRVSGFTRELDRVSEALFSLTTNGGEEYCGYTINTAVRNLNWSSSNQDVKAIFIAGNEPFTQGPVSYKAAIAAARQKGITVNTIHAGAYEEGTQSGWQDGAVLAGGNYMSIDADYRVAHVLAPQDQKIAELNRKLNQTYIPYGSQGKESAQRQLEQDKKSEAVSLGLLAKRAKSKSSALYNNAEWDLVDAVEAGSVDVKTLDAEALPPEIRSLDGNKRQTYIENKTRERKDIQEQISTLTKERDAYVAQAQRAAAAKPQVKTLHDALVSAVREQGEKKNFVIADE